jgi:hypothetical protein
MLEAAEVEVGAQLAVDADQQVQVERGRHAQRIVVGDQQVALGLDEIGAQQKRVPRLQRRRDAAQQRLGRGWIEIADVRSEE